MFTSVAPPRSITGAWCIDRCWWSKKKTDTWIGDEDEAWRRVYSGMHFAVINKGVIGFIESFFSWIQIKQFNLIIDCGLVYSTIATGRHRSAIDVLQSIGQARLACAGHWFIDRVPARDDVGLGRGKAYLDTVTLWQKLRVAGGKAREAGRARNTWKMYGQM